MAIWQHSIIPVHMLQYKYCSYHSAVCIRNRKVISISWYILPGFFFNLQGLILHGDHVLQAFSRAIISNKHHPLKSFLPEPIYQSPWFVFFKKNLPNNGCVRHFHQLFIRIARTPLVIGIWVSRLLVIFAKMSDVFAAVPCFAMLYHL